MAEPERNHYQVLGIERTADARAIKSAYFGLVRQFPPETHPEEFKRLRAAYEVLSDAEARKRYDAAETDFREYGDGLAEALRLCEEAIRAGDEPAAQSKLLAVLESRPELVIAREKLGESYLRSKSFPEALAQFQELVRLEPTEGRHRFHEGLVFGRMDEHDKADPALRQALELKPDDLDIRVALVDCLLRRDKVTEAIAELDRAIAAGSTTEQRLGLEVRRIDAYFRAYDATRARYELDQFIERIRQEKDPELHKYVATQLAAVAAREFAQMRPISGNDLLGRCQALATEEGPYHPYPTQVTLDVAALPESTQAALREQKPGPKSPVVGQSAWLRPLLAMAGCALLVAACHWFIWERPVRWGAGDLFAALLLLGGTITATAFTLRSVLQILQSPLRAFVSVQPLYLLQVRCQQVNVWSLFNLLNVEVTAHRFNGIYTSTSLRLRFPGKTLALTLRDHDFAVAWAHHVGECRQRTLELMMAGYLDAERDLDLVPHALLQGKAPRSAGAPRDVLRWLSASVAITLVALGLAVRVNRQEAGEARWQAAVRDGSLGAYRGYLAEAPAGPHAAEAEREIGRYVDRAAATFAARTDPEAPGVRALTEALQVLRRRPAEGGRLALVLQLPDEFPPGIGIRSGPGAARSPGEGAEPRRTALTTGIERALIATGLAGVIELDPSGQSGHAAPLTLTLRETASAEGEPLRAAGLPAILPLGSRWEVELMAAGAAQPLFRFSTTTTAPHELRVERPAAGGEAAWAQAAYMKLWQASAQAFLKKLVAEWGLGYSADPGPTSLVHMEAPRQRRSPYEP